MGAKRRFAWSKSPGRSRLREGSEGRSLKGQEELNDRGKGLSDSHVGGTAKPVTHVSQIRDVKMVARGTELRLPYGDLRHSFGEGERLRVRGRPRM